MALLEVLIGSVLVAVAAVGVALMFSSGQASIHSDGDNRVAVFLANQRIEQLRAQGWDAVAIPDPEATTPNDLTDEGYPGYTRTTYTFDQCPSNYQILRSDGGCASAPTMTAKLIVVTIMRTGGTSTTPTYQCPPEPVGKRACAVMVKTQ